MTLATLLAARDAVLYDQDVLMLVFMQLPFEKTKQANLWWGRSCPLLLYAHVAATCHVWNDVLRGKRLGLHKSAQFLLRRLLEHATSPSSPGVGLIVRPRICAALGISVAKANAIPVTRGFKPYGSHCVSGMYKMPDAFDYVMETEGGWAGLLKRFQTKVKAKVGAEERKATSLELAQKAKLAELKPALAALGCTLPDGAEDDPAAWKKLKELNTAISALLHAKENRLQHAAQRGGGRYEELVAKVGPR